MSAQRLDLGHVSWSPDFRSEPAPLFREGDSPSVVGLVALTASTVEPGDGEARVRRARYLDDLDMATGAL